MQCRNCGIEIADKALICYRCGTATTEAKFKPYVPARRRRRSLLLVVVLVLALLVLLAWLLLHSAATPAIPADVNPATKAGAIIDQLLATRAPDYLSVGWSAVCDTLTFVDSLNRTIDFNPVIATL